MSNYLDLDGLTTLINGIKNGDLVPGKVNASTINGTISVDNLPQGALERLVIVSSDAARYALRSTQVQVGDTVKVTATGKMYYVKDDTKLASALGYEEYTVGTAASVPWSGVTGKPSNATTTTAGFMSAADKAKLDGIDPSASNYTLPIATREEIGGVKIAGTITAGNNDPTTTSGRTYLLQLGSDGKTGAVNVPWTDTTYNTATQVADGLLSSADKKKLDGLSPIDIADIQDLF